jgi:DNA polymerase-3 subunit delta'
MPLVPLYGHESLRRRLAAAVRRGTLPSSLVIHGPPGIGKQRLAIWLAQLLLCERDGDAPCGSCPQCRYSAGLTHPDLRWFFPRERLSSDAGPADVQEDIAEGIAERVKASGLYPRPAGNVAIYVATVRALVQLASLTPTLARRKVFVIGDAERMVAQEGSEQAANAFLKLLEEPPDDTTIILTTSEIGALLPTIRSRVIAVRAAPLDDAAMRAFAADPLVRDAVQPTADTIALAAGAPGGLVDAEERAKAVAAARDLFAAATQGRAGWSKACLAVGSTGARGFFSDMLDALLRLLAERQRAAASQQRRGQALSLSEAMQAVERAKERAANNANPQLLASVLIPYLAKTGTE